MTDDDRKPRVLAYARASTRKQVDSPEAQKEAMRRYAEYNRLGDPTYFTDAAKSGKVAWEEREAGSALFGQIRFGDHVVVAKLDRAFRRLADCVVVLEKLERLGAKLHICNLMGGAIDLSSPMGKFMIHILAAFAELERAFISERTREGLARRKAAKVAHTKHPGYGFRWKKVRSGGKTVKVRERDDEERNVMRSIVAWRMQDPPLAWAEIADHLTKNLNIVTKEGRRWDRNRVMRAHEAELLLQMAESRNTG